MPDSPQRSAEVLNSWKQIAMYLGRGVRTVQRWERDLGLPVHRPRGKHRSAVLAIPDELDQWVHRTPAQALNNAISNHVDLAKYLRDQSRIAETAQEGKRLMSQAKAVFQQAVAARERMSQLAEQLRVSARCTRELMSRRPRRKSI